MSRLFSKPVVPVAFILAFALTALSGRPAWSQDDAAEEPAQTEEGGNGSAGEATGTEGGEPESGESVSEESETGGGPAVDLDENPELDRQTHERDDDDFIPSEEIPVDQAIPFPTDI